MYKKDLFFMGAAVAMAGFLVIVWKSGLALPNPPREEELTVLPAEEAPPVDYRGILYSSGRKIDRIMDCYRNTASVEEVIAFFSELTGSEEVAAAVLAEADAFDVSPALAFSLAWEESRYNPRIESRKNGNYSVDRGLFQLNSYSFPELSETDFFNPRINASYGISHLRWCLNTGGSEVPALAMYNAGLRRVSTGGTPRRTLDYISRVLLLRENIESLFEAEHSRGTAPAAETPRRNTSSIAEKERMRQNSEPRGFLRAIL